METLQFQLLLFVLHAINQYPDVLKHWLVLFELNVLEDKVASVSSFQRLLLPYLFFQRVLGA